MSVQSEHSKRDDWTKRANQTHRRATSRRRSMMLVVLGSLAVFAILQWLTIVVLRSDMALRVPETIQNSALLLTGAFLLTQFIGYRMARVSTYRVGGQILPIWSILVLIAMAFLLLFRFDYSIWFFVITFLTGTICLSWFAVNLVKRHSQNVALPGALLTDDLAVLTNSKAVNFIALGSPNLPETPVDIIAVDQDHMKDPNWTPFLSWCSINAVPVVSLQEYIERHTGRIDSARFVPSDMLKTSEAPSYMSVKRLADIVICTMALILLCLPMLVIAIIIRLGSSGPALFTQRRLGRGGRPFTIYKFRSMTNDAEAKGAQFASSQDARVTGIGKFIRKSRIDELPQLYNVIIGDMSLIGPRPEQVDLMDQLVKEIPLFPLRHSVRPGITGWAQVCQGYADDVESTRLKIEYDLFYIKNVSLLLDLNIVLRTIKIILSGFGAR